MLSIVTEEVHHAGDYLPTSRALLTSRIPTLLCGGSSVCWLVATHFRSRDQSQPCSNK